MERRIMLFAGDPVETIGPLGERPFPLTDGFAAYNAIQLSNGRLLVVGGKGGGSADEDRADAILLKRDFTLDKSFGGGGAVDTFLSRITDVAECPNGKIIAFGEIELPPVVTFQSGA